jgi:capsid protein
MNLIDKGISLFNPEKAYKRQTYRRALDILEKKRSYEAASHEKRNQGWKATGASANTEIATAGTTLRARSRELVRNNSYAKKANRVIVNNVVGTGIKPSPQGENKELGDTIKKAWSWIVTGKQHY